MKETMYGDSDISGYNFEFQKPTKEQLEQKVMKSNIEQNSAFPIVRYPKGLFFFYFNRVRFTILSRFDRISIKV